MEENREEVLSSEKKDNNFNYDSDDFGERIYNLIKFQEYFVNFFILPFLFLIPLPLITIAITIYKKEHLAVIISFGLLTFLLITINVLLRGVVLFLKNFKKDLYNIFSVCHELYVEINNSESELGKKYDSDKTGNFKGAMELVILPVVKKVLCDKIFIVGWFIYLFLDIFFKVFFKKIEKDNKENKENLTEFNKKEFNVTDAMEFKKKTEKITNNTFIVITLPIQILEKLINILSVLLYLIIFVIILVS